MSRPVEWFGRPSIHPVAFFAGKVAFAIPMLWLVAGALGAGPTGANSWLRGLGISFLAAGAAVVAAAFAGLGGSVRIGLPREETSLRTGGIYRWSRNPMYVGVFAVCIASVLLRPHVVPAACTLVTIVVHHRIVLAEERFLERRFGQAWLDYRARVRRYF